MNKITVSTSVRYDLLMEEGLLQRSGEIAREVTGTCKACIISDKTVHDLYLEMTAASFASAGFDVRKVVLPPGETSKSLQSLEMLLEYLAQEQFTVIDGSYETSQGEMPMYRFKSPSSLSQEELEDVLPILNRIQDWISSVFTYVADEAISHGRKWRGYKVVEGKATRKYLSEKMVEDACKKAGYTDIYEQSLLPLTKLEKKLTKPEFKRILVDEGLVIKPRGKLTLTEEDDPRDAVDPERLEEESRDSRSKPEDVFRPIAE